MNNKPNDQDYAKSIYGATVETIIAEHIDLLTQYSEYVLKELVKSVTNDLGNTIPAAYLE